MNRFFLLLCVAFCSISSLAVTPEEINGEWEAKKWIHTRTNIPEITVSQRDYYDFFTDGTFIARIQLRIKLAIVARVTSYVNISYRGAYTISDDFITLMPDNSTFKVETPKDEITSTGPDLGVYETPIKKLVASCADDIADRLRKEAETEYFHDVKITEDKKWRKLTYKTGENKKEREFRQKIEN